MPQPENDKFPQEPRRRSEECVFFTLTQRSVPQLILKPLTSQLCRDSKVLLTIFAAPLPEIIFGSFTKLKSLHFTHSIADKTHRLGNNVSHIFAIRSSFSPSPSLYRLFSLGIFVRCPLCTVVD